MDENMTKIMHSCAILGGCPTDYVAVGITALNIIVNVLGTLFACTVYEVPKIHQLHVLLIQCFGSINFLLSLVIASGLFKLNHRASWQSCYIWAVWVEGPCGFALLLGGRIAQAYRLHYLFVKRQLPPIKSYQLILLMLLPWIGMCILTQVKRPLGSHCVTTAPWIVAVTLEHGLFVVILICVTWTIRHIDFKFNEFKGLVNAVIIAVKFEGVWSALYITSKHVDADWPPIVLRFSLVLMGNLLVLCFFWTSTSRLLFTKLRTTKPKSDALETISKLLGVPNNGLLCPTGMPLKLDQPFEKLLQEKRFRQSFMAFADSRMAGESVHFYDEVYELNKIPAGETAWKIYMAGHIIERYVVVGSPLEINISHQMRQEILNTTDITNPDLFKHAVKEMLQIMRMNLERDYYRSPFYLQFKGEIKAEAEAGDLMECMVGWDHSPKLSSARCADDPFHQDYTFNKSENESQETSMQHSMNYDEDTCSAKRLNPMLFLKQNDFQQPRFNEGKKVGMTIADLEG